ncbi:MAG: LysR family transcriptional regulator [Proteobacteria bacterium]|nr:MAG: LysR family transcriptional regulator [Pseudomonadota bacterium]
MKLFQLQLLKTVLNNGLNISRAADQHFVVQSAVSRQLSLLEAELGVPLFERKGKRLLRPTPLSLAIVREVDAIELSLENIRAISDDFRDGRQGDIRIATTHMQAKYFLPPVLNEFRQRYPKVKVHFLQGNPRQLVQMLHDNDADIAICTEEIADDKALTSHFCYTWNHVLILPEGHELCEGELSLERIAQYPILTYVLGFTGRSKIETAFKKQKLTIDTSFSATDSDVIKSYVRLGFGVGIISGIAHIPEESQGLVMRDLSAFFPESITRIAYMKNKHLKSYLIDIVDIMKQKGQLISS